MRDTSKIGNYYEKDNCEKSLLQISSAAGLKILKLIFYSKFSLAYFFKFKFEEFFYLCRDGYDGFGRFEPDVEKGRIFIEKSVTETVRDAVKIKSLWNLEFSHRLKSFKFKIFIEIIKKSAFPKKRFVDQVFQIQNWRFRTDFIYY